MATKDDKQRHDAKAHAVAARIAEIAPHAGMILAMLDETKLDMLILALGIGGVELSE